MPEPSAGTPVQTVGILGGGQLGRMLALAGARLGLAAHVYCPDPASPAFDVARRHVVASYDDEAALAAFAAGVDVVTYEFENVPAATASPMRRAAAAVAGATAAGTRENFRMWSRCSFSGTS